MSKTLEDVLLNVTRHAIKAYKLEEGLAQDLQSRVFYTYLTRVMGKKDLSVDNCIPFFIVLVRTCLIDECRLAYRRRERCFTGFHPLAGKEELVSYDQTFCDLHCDDLIAQVKSRLDEREQRIVDCLIEGLSHEEIGKIIDRKTITVRSDVYRMRDKIKDLSFQV